MDSLHEAKGYLAHGAWGCSPSTTSTKTGDSLVCWHWEAPDKATLGTQHSTTNSLHTRGVTEIMGNGGKRPGINTHPIRWLRDLVLSFLPRRCSQSRVHSLGLKQMSRAWAQAYSPLIGRTRFVKKRLWPGVHASSSDDAAGRPQSCCQGRVAWLIIPGHWHVIGHLPTELTFGEHGSHQRPQQGHVLDAETVHALRSGLRWLRTDQPQHTIPVHLCPVCTHDLHSTGRAYCPPRLWNQETGRSKRVFGDHPAHTSTRRTITILWLVPIFLFFRPWVTSSRKKNLSQLAVHY